MIFFVGAIHESLRQIAPTNRRNGKSQQQFLLFVFPVRTPLDIPANVILFPCTCRGFFLFCNTFGTKICGV